ncbi:MAG: hypothetical protein ACRDQA_12500 [Nocardioidaceae bacterium]
MTRIRVPASMGITWRPLPQQDDFSRQPMITKRGFRGFVLHTAVSNGTSIWPYFSSASAAGVESTLYIRKNGTGEQYVWLDQNADCQMDGNWWSAFGGSGFASIETWDGAGTSLWSDWRSNGNGGPPWTSAQIESITDILAWASKPDVLNYPIQKATGPRGYGIGWHRQFTSTTPYCWNHSHACPGDARVDQIPGVIAKAKRKATTTNIPLGDDMQLSDQVEFIGNEAKQGFYGDRKSMSVRSLLMHAAIGGRQLRYAVLPVLADIQGDIGKQADPSMSDADRQALADAIAAKVDALRVTIDRELADEEDAK